MSILIIDDSILDRSFLMAVLKEHHVKHNILEAADGEEAMKVLSQHRDNIGLICLDWQMPKMDGMDFMRAVVKVPEVSSIPIVMVTASGAQEAQNCARRVNPHLAGYIVKPYKAEDLMAAIAPFL